MCQCIMNTNTVDEFSVNEVHKILQINKKMFYWNVNQDDTRNNLICYIKRNTE